MKPQDQQEQGKKLNWNEADSDGLIHVPDEYDGLVNMIGTQLKFHTISGKGEGQTIADILKLCEEFFETKASRLRIENEKLRAGLKKAENDLQELDRYAEELKEERLSALAERNEARECEELLQKENEGLRRGNDMLKEAIHWALGYTDFRGRAPGEGALWWRTELRRRSKITASEFDEISKRLDSLPSAPQANNTDKI